MATKTRPTDPRFHREGPIEWAILAPLDAARLEALVAQCGPRRYVDLGDDDGPRSRCIVAGSKKYSALIETAPGSASSELDLAKKMSKQLGATIYSVSFSGYADPDHGAPDIRRYDAGKVGIIWVSGDDRAAELGAPPIRTAAGPKGVPATDPFAFAKALGCDLRPYFEP